MRPRQHAPAAVQWLIRSAGVALAYLACGKLALLLAIPPGYAAPVWPAAGIALAAILILGYRVWPGVFLGSLLVNVSAPTGLADLPQVLAAIGIGLGAVIQAVLGAYLIRRLIGFPRSFDQPRELLLATCLAGPINCIVGASIGVATLLASGTMSAAQAPSSWATWWFGDTLGVLVVFPLASAWGMELRAAPRKYLLVGVPLLIGTALTVTLFLDTRQTEQEHAQLEFERRAEIVARGLEQSITAKLDIALSVVSLFNSSDEVNRSEFRRFVEPLLEAHVGLQGLSWNARVPADERPAYEERARRDGIEGFEFIERAQTGSMVPARERDEYLPVYFVEPLSTNRRALGFDLASDPTRVGVLERTRDSGMLLATPPVSLVQEPDRKSGFLVFAPVYAAGKPLDTTIERRTHHHSYVSAIFKSALLVEDALDTFSTEGIACSIVDATDPDRPEPLYAGSMAADPATPYRWTTTLELGGRRWQAEFRPTASYSSAVSTGRSLPVLAGGLFFTSLLGGFLLIVAGRASMIQRVVDERTADLSTANTDLSREITERMRAEAGLREAHDLLEARVVERTAELVCANDDLQLEVQERKLAQAALGASESRFRAVFQASSIGIAVGGPDGRLLEVNDYIGEMLGIPRATLVGRSLDEFLTPADANPGPRGPNPASPSTIEDERRFRTLDERFGWAMVRETPLLDAAGNVRYRLCVLEDITSRRRFEEHLSRSQKLESVGLLAGGIAHDFNNLLTAILGNLSMARADAPPSSGMLPFLDQAERALARATGLTRQLLTFSKGGAPVTQVVELPRIVQEAAEFALGGSTVRCDVVLPDDLWNINADPGQLHQVMINLLLNSAQAMPDGGTVLIHASNQDVEGHESLKPGRYVRLTVEDEGVGVPVEYRSQIFDPYFTTKPSGSGLGLATAYSILRKHGGDLVLAPDSGTGAAFQLYLPMTEQTATSAAELEILHDTSTAAGRVLIMDDDPAIRTLVATIVSRLGYQIDLARDGAEALGCFGEAVDSGQPHCAVILDLTIPGGMGGKDTLVRMKEIDPDVQAIVSSGYSEDPILADYRAHGFVGVVAKPYRVADLAEALRRVAQGDSEGAEG